MINLFKSYTEKAALRGLSGTTQAGIMYWNAADSQHIVKQVM